MPRNGTSLEQKAEWMRERHSSQSIGPSPVTLISAERHYSVAEVSAMWNLSQDAVRKIFQNEPGVLVLGEPRFAAHAQIHDAPRPRRASFREFIGG